jgi:hypothetical protein
MYEPGIGMAAWLSVEGLKTKAPYSCVYFKYMSSIFPIKVLAGTE